MTLHETLASSYFSAEAKREGKHPSLFRRFFLCRQEKHRAHEYKKGHARYSYCQDCGETKYIGCSSRVLWAIKNRPHPLTDDYIRHMMCQYDNDTERTNMDRHAIQTVIAMDACNVQTVDEWDILPEKTISSGYEKAAQRITRILREDGKIPPETRATPETYID
jgi:hypothetical protein